MIDKFVLPWIKIKNLLRSCFHNLMFLFQRSIWLLLSIWCSSCDDQVWLVTRQLRRYMKYSPKYIQQNHYKLKKFFNRIHSVNNIFQINLKSYRVHYQDGNTTTAEMTVWGMISAQSVKYMYYTFSNSFIRYTFLLVQRLPKYQENSDFYRKNYSNKYYYILYFQLIK